MSRQLLSIYLLATSITYGWRSETAKPSLPISEKRFPLNESQAWYLEQSYLIWKPHEDNLWYTAKTGVHSRGGAVFKIKKETPDFGWYSGARVVLGRYLPKHGQWDIFLATTYYYAPTDDHTHADRSKGTVLNPRWVPDFIDGVTSSKVTWRLNYFTWDLALGRYFTLTKKLNIHPLFGLRAALIYQDYRNRSINEGADQFSLYFKAREDLWGIGPRGGVDFDFKFQRRWSILGSISSSLILGGYDLEEMMKTSFLDSIFNLRETNTVREDSFSIRANLEGKIGIGWEYWLAKHHVRLAPSFLFEATNWYNLNQFFTIHREKKPGDIALVKKQPPSGSMGLMGFSLNLQVDF